MTNLPAGVDAAEFSAAAADEIRQVVEAVTLVPGGDARDIFTTDLFLDDPRLSAVYGFAAHTPTQTTTSVANAGRGGILGRAAFLVGQVGVSSPSIVLRGKFIRESILCGSLNAPPDGVLSANEDLANQLPPDHTERDVSQLRLQATSCKGCHAQMDPLAYAFEKFGGAAEVVDAFDDVVTLDDNGMIPAAGAADAGTEIHGADEFGAWVASRPGIGKCLTQHFLRQAVGQSVNDGQLVAQKRMADAFAAAGYDVRALMRSIAKDEAFRTVSCATDL